MTIARIDEAALLNAGIDRQTVLALRHVLRQVGDRVGGTTLPEVSGALVEDLQPQIDAISLLLTALIELASQQPPTLPPAGEQEDAAPPQRQLIDANDEQGELRALAEEVARLRTEIDAIKQGTTL